MKAFIYSLFLTLLLSAGYATNARACGHGGWYAGTGYAQMFSYSFDNQLAGGGASSQLGNVNFRTRFGGYVKVGRDFCTSRFGFEIPFSYNRQRLNRSEVINVFTLDGNAVIHLLQTSKGGSIYWIVGTGFSRISEGSLANNTDAVGVNLNTGPGFQLFFKNNKPKMSLGISFPLTYTLYFGNNLSKRMTQVFSAPIHVGFTVGF